VHASVISMSDNLDEWIVVGFYIKNIWYLLVVHFF
jgi:hypothetical protein